MGVSTDGQICYGICFEEDTVFPWDAEEFDGDIEDWWVDGANGYKPPFEVYDEKGNYLNGVKPSEETLSAYYAPRWKFKKEHPLPIEMVNGCSRDYPVWILAAKGLTLSANRGYPKSFEPSALVATGKQTVDLIEFCKIHDIDTNGAEPKWWLSSYDA